MHISVFHFIVEWVTGFNQINNKDVSRFQNEWATLFQYFKKLLQTTTKFDDKIPIHTQMKRTYFLTLYLPNRHITRALDLIA